MKKYMNPEVNFVSLDANDVIATSIGTNDVVGNRSILVGGRFADEYDEEEEW